MKDIQELKSISTQVRRDIIRMVTNAKSGHPGGSMSSADFLTALYFNVMKHNPETWTRNGKGQDVFILSAGHLTPVYYSILSRAGYFPVSELSTFRVIGTRLQGHPCIETGLAGIVQASGSLGQGLSAAAGIAIGKKMDKAKAEAEAIANAQVESITDANGLQAVKVTFDSGILFATNKSELNATAKNSLKDFARSFMPMTVVPIPITQCV